MRKALKVALVTLIALSLTAQAIFACTIIAVGKDATVDGSTIVTHNDDSGGADFRLWIIPGGEWPEGSMRNIAVDSHNYGDFSNFPEVEDYGNGYVAAQTPQPKETYAYFHSRYSFMNEKGVAIGEATNGLSRKTEAGEKAWQALFASNLGIIDCWNAQDIALERAKTAREAVRIMGNLVEEFGWGDSCETMNITDGNEVWVAEFYGKDMWCAVRIPDDHFFIAANSARISYIDFNDPDNYMWAPNIKTFAIENGLWSEDSGIPFSPADLYCPSGANLRVWRGFDLVAPSLNLDPTTKASELPLSVKPERKLSVQDIFEIKGDYYQGTEYDKSTYAEAGPWGNPNAHTRQRSIGVPQTCYVHIGQIKSWLPDKIKGVSWFGYGGADTTYLTPLWPAMEKLPDFYSIGNRYEDFRRDSGWWTNSYVQQVAEINYQSAVPRIHEFRQEKMDKQYAQVDNLQTLAARLIRQGMEDDAMDLISTYAYWTAVDWHEKWLGLGDELMGTYMWGRKDMKSQTQSQWWLDIMASAPRRPADQPF